MSRRRHEDVELLKEEYAGNKEHEHLHIIISS